MQRDGGPRAPGATVRLVALCLAGVLVSTHAVIDPANIWKPIPFQLDGIDYVLHYEPLTFVDAVATCADDNLLPGGRPGSVLHFEALIPTFAHATTALPDIANAIIEGYGLTSDPDQAGYNLWVWDSSRTCRAFWFDLGTSMFSATDVTCTWTLGFVCVDAEAAEQRGWQTSLPWYRSYLASRVQPSPAAQLGPDTWGWSLADGEAVGSFSPPLSITAYFNSTPALWQTGPPVSMLYRGGGHNVYALRPVQDSAASVAKSWELFWDQRNQLAGNHSAYWGVFDLTRDYGAAFEVYNVVPDAHDYVVSVQGCYLPGVQLERLYFVTRTGRNLQFGRGYCTAWFRQDAPPGGYLAAVAGWSLNQTLWPAGPPYDMDVSFIYQIRPIWAVPPGGSPPPPMSVDLPPQLPAGGGACPASRPPVAASARQLGLPGECGAATGAVCNSNQCCGVMTWGRNRLYAVCGTGVAPCQTGCMSGYGMCGVLPEQPLLTFVRPPSPPLSSYTPLLLLDASNTPLIVNGSRVVNWTSTVTSPSAAYDSAPLSASNPHQPLPVLYVLKTDGPVTYSDALAFCNSSTHLGLSWEMVGVADSLGFTVSGTMRRGAYTAIKDTVMWFHSDPDYVKAAPGYACIRGKYGPQPAGVYDETIVGLGPCGITAAAMCRAVGLTSATTSKQLAGQLRRLQQPSSTTAAAPPAAATVWKPGRHSVWLSAKHGAGPFSSGSCGFALAAVPQLEAALLQQLASFVADADAPAAAVSQTAGAGNTTTSTTAATVGNSTAAAPTTAASITLPGTYIGDVDVSSLQPPLAGLSLSRASFADNSSDASDLIAGLRLHLNTSSQQGPSAGITATRVAGVESTGGWEGMALVPGEVVVAVSVCAGGFVERLVLHTSTGRLLTHAWSRHARCTRGFTEAAPAGGYLLGMAGHVGSYVEDLVLAWGSPLPTPPPTLPPPPAPPVVDTAAAGGATDGRTNTTSTVQPTGSSPGTSSSSSNNTGVIVGAVVGGTVLLVGLLAAALLLLRRRRSPELEKQNPSDSIDARGGKASIRLDATTSGSGHHGGGSMALVAAGASGIDPRSAEAHGCGGISTDWLPTDNFPSSMRDTGNAVALSTTSVTAAGAGAGTAAVRQEAKLVAAGRDVGCAVRGGSSQAAAAAAWRPADGMGVGMGLLVAVAHDDLDTDLDLDGDLLGAHDHQTEDGEAQLLGHGAVMVAAVAAAAAADTGAVAGAPRSGGSSSGGLRFAGASSGDGTKAGAPLTSTASNWTGTTAAVSGTMYGSSTTGAGSTGASGTDSRQAGSQATSGPDLSGGPGGTDVWAAPQALTEAAAAVGIGSGLSATPRKGSTVGPSLTAQRVAADSSLTARGNLVPAHADRAMEVVLAPGASGRAGSVVNLGRGSTGAGPYQPPVLAAIVAAHNTASGGGAYSPPAPSSVKQEDTTTPPGPMSSAEGVALAAAAVATGSNESLAGPPPLMLGKNVAVDWKGILGRGCSCVVYRGMLTLPPGEGPAAGVAEGATIPVAVKLLMHLAAAAVEEGGAAAVPTSAGDGSDRAVGDGAALPAALAQLNPVPLSPELRGQLRMLQAEVAVLSRLDHPNIVKYYGACLEPTTTAAGAVRNSSGGGLETSSASAGGDAGSGSGKSGATSYSVPPGMSIDMPFLVEELMHVPLSRVIHARHLNGSGAFLHDYGLVDILRICRDVANALAYLHPTVVHRDLKPANVLLDERGTAKVGDFGLARFKAGTLLATTNVEVGTTPYMAPENFAAGGEAAVSDKSDVFALGVLINEMVTRQRPWTGTRSAVVGYLVAIEGQRPTMAPADHPHCPPGLRSLIQRCWRQNPDERPSGAEIVKRLTLLLAEHAAAAL